MAKALKFMADSNVGKLARWLRLMGYDTVYYSKGSDDTMVLQALKENRVLLTRDTGIMERRVVTDGKLKAILLTSDEPQKQIRQVLEELHLAREFKLFSLCLECNQPLEERGQEDVKERVPPYVYQTQEQYMECPCCRRIYWRGTHWSAMTDTLKKYLNCTEREEN